ncbi:rho GTPase-activating protein 28 [Oryzias melastigma]|uniref:rho GTPase-activating protein 28 n=1 Tax=Oryzias melastigma TaxID=30732 RepID=UPI00168D1AC6|nr:rho GTPase-activating protein 28 [Oryzias melastigma]
MEETWLKEAGLFFLVSGIASSEASLPLPEAVISTLTHQQAAIVRARLDNYNETLRKRNRQPLRDVRDIFAEVGNPEEKSAELCSSPSPHSADFPPGRYHTTTKTIRLLCVVYFFAARPHFVFEDQLTDHPSCSSLKAPQANTNPSCPVPSNPPPACHWRQADWLLQDTPYSEGVAEHRRSSTCWDCQSFQGDLSGKLQFVPVIPSKGLTCIDDLSPRDLTRLGFISHIELTTFLLALGVQTKRNRPSRTKAQGAPASYILTHEQEGAVFGVTLKSLLENDKKKFPGIKIPIVFKKLLSILEQSGLQMEGILRVPASVARLKYLRKELDRHPEVFDWSAVRQVDAAGLLKLFIRELPTPLLTYTHLPTFSSVMGISSELHQVQALQLLTLLLPEVHRDTLKALLVFLWKVVSHQDQNRMSLWNVSMVMAPNLFPQCNHGKRHSPVKQSKEIEVAVGGAQLIQLMIQHQDLLWTVPNFLLTQVRQLNQASNQKQLSLSRTKTYLLKKKKNQNDGNQITKLCEGVIQVHAPQHTKVSMAIQLEEQTTAKDVTARFEGQNSPPQRLYEVGGNICERRLHPDCPLMEVYRVNPCCDWLIKPGLVSSSSAGELNSQL